MPLVITRLDTNTLFYASTHTYTVTSIPLGLTSPITYLWTADAGCILQNETTDTVILTFPVGPLPATVSISVTITDSTPTTPLTETATLPESLEIYTDTFAMVTPVEISLNPYDLTSTSDDLHVSDDDIHVKLNLNALLNGNVTFPTADPWAYVGTGTVANSIRDTWDAKLHPTNGKNGLVQFTDALEELFEVSENNNLNPSSSTPVILDTTKIATEIKSTGKIGSHIFTSAHLDMFLDAVYDHGQAGYVEDVSLNKYMQVAHGTKFSIPVNVTSQTADSSIATKHWHVIVEHDGNLL